MTMLDNVPLNIKRSYIMAKTHSGCKIYVPVDIDGSYTELVVAKKNELQELLNNQPVPFIDNLLA